MGWFDGAGGQGDGEELQYREFPVQRKLESQDQPRY